jgi:hypothetical protein
LNNQLSSIRLANDPLRAPVERIVSDCTERKWTVTEAKDMAELACHPAAIFSDGSYSIFAKFIEAANGIEQVEIELAGSSFPIATSRDDLQNGKTTPRNRLWGHQLVSRRGFARPIIADTAPLREDRKWPALST